jgi:hypothetical protein
MTVVLLTATGAQTWQPPADCPAGTPVTVETWGAGCGGSGRVSSTFGAAGGGGAYASTPYVVSAHDAANGIACSIGTGSAGTSGANPSAGGATSFSTNTNIIRNSSNAGAAMPSTLPNNWAVYGGGGLTWTIVGLGISTRGNPYIQISIVGTTTATDANITINFDGATLAGVATYVLSVGVQILAGGLTNIASVEITNNAYSDTGGNTYLSSPIFDYITPTTSYVVYQSSAANPATTQSCSPAIEFDYLTGAAINITVQLEAMQLELGTTATYYRTTPAYTLAAGGRAPSGTTGGGGGLTTASSGITLNGGGGGAAYNANGSGGGGAGGKDGAGVAGTTAGVGGRGDATTGGTGGTVSATTPGNPGTSNVEGGGGGGGLKTVAGTGGAGGAPGGGGGAAAVATGTGGAGANGQIRLTYASTYFPTVARPQAIQIWG